MCNAKSCEKYFFILRFLVVKTIKIFEVVNRVFYKSLDFISVFVFWQMSKNYKQERRFSIKHKKLFTLGLAGILFCTSVNAFATPIAHSTYFSSIKGNSGQYEATVNCTEISVYGHAKWGAQNGIAGISYQTYTYPGSAVGVQPAEYDITSSNSNSCSISLDTSGRYSIYCTYMVFYADGQVVIDYNSNKD